MFIYGDSLQNNVVAIIVIDRPHAEAWFKEKGKDTSDYEAMLQDESYKWFILDEIKKMAKQAGFFGFEVPFKIHLTSTIFSVENDILTPTFKLKRNEAKQYFFSQIKEMYDGALLQGEEK